jgi:hypothetical protein
MESIKMLLESKKGWLTTSLEVAIEGGEKMQIYGFVILPESLQEDFIFGSLTDEQPQLGQAKVQSDRILFNIDGKVHRLPIFNRVRKNYGKPVSIKYLYISKFSQLKNEKVIYEKTFLTGNAERLSKYQFIDNTAEEGKYIPSSDDFLFSSSSRLSGVGSKFLVICRRKNTETGYYCFECFMPDDLYLTDDEKYNKEDYEDDIFSEEDF